MDAAHFSSMPTPLSDIQSMIIYHYHHSSETSQRYQQVNCACLRFSLFYFVDFLTLHPLSLPDGPPFSFSFMFASASIAFYIEAAVACASIAVVVKFAAAASACTAAVIVVALLLPLSHPSVTCLALAQWHCL